MELTRKPHTDGTVELSVKVPRDQADAIQAALDRLLIQLGEPGEEIYSVEMVLPDMTPGKVLRGARGLAELTQAQLADKLGVHKTNISEMERDKRPIGKEMARRLGTVLRMDYKVFL